MLNSALLLAASLLLAALLMAEKRGRSEPVLVFKTPLSVLFVVAALMQPHPIQSYYQWVVAGLVFGLVGDVSLTLKGGRAFKVGLVAFLLGHIMYIVAFVDLTRASDWTSVGNIIIACVGLGIFLWLSPHLGEMMVPVCLYLVVISVMLAAAWIVFLNTELPEKAAWSILLGSLLFYMSDLLVARQRFVKSEFMNRLLGLPLYYAGQFLIAFSVGLIS